MGTKRKYELRIKLPDAKHMEYIQAAANIANAFRVSKREPVISVERLALNAIIEGSNQIHNEYARMVQSAKDRQQQEQSAADAVEVENQEQVNAAE